MLHDVTMLRGETPTAEIIGDGSIGLPGCDFELESCMIWWCTLKIALANQTVLSSTSSCYSQLGARH